MHRKVTRTPAQNGPTAAVAASSELNAQHDNTEVNSTEVSQENQAQHRLCKCTRRELTRLQITGVNIAVFLSTQNQADLGSTPSTRLRYCAMAASPSVHKDAKKQASLRNSSTASLPSQKQEAPDTPSPISENSQGSSTDKSNSPSPHRSTLLSPTWSRRQHEFMAAIEAEACSDFSPNTNL
ncbi:hypothetical protein PF008_g15871 [Phytophthora fragariae]|uniref:Uncharacterized protein n=1 Tax=Phytophthora fragariae TaxID=53985 RepID=A0A6G0RDB7_9STRA|nr:hypothetical protein PF008_g15871 [Phytophthora fragariae]